jgi:hypothetical protein
MVMVMKAKSNKPKSCIKSLDFPTDQTVFKALEALPCYGCGSEIASGDLFTRKGDKAGQVEGLRYVFCLKCRPLTWSGPR